MVTPQPAQMLSNIVVNGPNSTTITFYSQANYQGVEHSYNVGTMSMVPTADQFTFRSIKIPDGVAYSISVKRTNSAASLPIWVATSLTDDSFVSMLFTQSISDFGDLQLVGVNSQYVTSSSYSSEFKMIQTMTPSTMQPVS